MAVIDITKKVGEFGGGNDSIVIARHGDDIPGGKTLEVKDFKGDIIRAGHVVVTDGKGVYKPLNIVGGAYEKTPTGFKPAGVVVRSVSKEMPAVSIMVSGIVNEGASPAPATDEIKGTLPRLTFIYGKASASAPAESH